ncbi:helix-turn-helix transcriptional regulator [Siculibacillus lacustris]|uniref:Helix-turn-helix transcriptional regulator n=1 Tax=Siculibacillus lacustris TaxID=1549641 RepID=A0A4V2KTQ5_9HYPH|nr:helix-turn-helix transcriptional regulator [Siculibacillus lacustris]TBW38248.1 helix-turn-helix transcriptional regulator [Siculibacillus lacustris]
MIDLVFDDLIGRIYEAGAVPELWSALFEHLRAVLNAEFGLLVTVRQGEQAWVGCARARAIMTDYFEQGWTEQDPRRTALLRSKRAGFVHELDFWPAEILGTLPVYRDFYHPRGIGWATATMIESPDSAVTIFHFERTRAQGPWDRPTLDLLDRLRPHLARAALLAGRAGEGRHRASLDTFAASGIAAALLGSGGRLIALNDAFRPHRALLQIGPGDRVALADRSANALFLATLGAGDGEPRSIPLRDAHGKPVAVLHLLPVRRSAHDVFDDARTILVLSVLDARAGGDPTLLKGLYDLTPTEAVIAAGIHGGATLEEISQAAGMSRETARSHLKRVFHKTGVSRQAELVALLASASTLKIRSS